MSGGGRDLRAATAIIALCWLTTGSTLAAETVWSIAKLNASKGDWSRLSDTSLRVEGRIASHLRGQLRFQQCNLSFRLTPELERKMGQAKNLEVVGTVKREGNSWIFEVSDVRTQPTDIEQFRSRESALKNPQPDDWYHLADWARERGEFYKDEDLTDAALLCVTRGISTELTRLKPDDYAGRFAVADKAQELSVPAKLVDEIRHEAYRAWWIPASSTAKPNPELLAALEKRLRSDWPDALTPGSPFPTDLSREYADHPSETYRKTEPTQRQILRRIFGSEVQLRQLQLQAAPDGKNGREIAELIERQIPERKGAAELYRDAELMYRLSQVATSSKGDALELARQLRERQRPKEASEALLRWLVAKEQRLRPQTAPEFVELADDYLTLLQDEVRCVSLLVEAHRREPQSPEALSRFEQLGYSFDGVSWKKISNTPTTSPAPQTLGAPAQLVAGMLMVDLTKLLGEPTSRTRIATAAAHEEFWIYGRAGEGSRLVVELRRGTATEPYRVAKFYSR
ncbi:MAG: hypothetical protein SFV23_14430 [Planctomycetaceae bacterium]|nr:hypothetical protein [Planctomycetaceae bacterium]